MIIYFDRLYRHKGIRRLAHFLKPRILSSADYHFPVSSVLHWWKPSHELQYFTKDYGYLHNVDRAQITSIFEYSSNTEGKFLKRNFIPNPVITQNAKMCKEYRFLKPNQFINVSDKVLKIVNYGYINARYKYQAKLFSQYHFYRNNIGTVLDNLFILDRQNIFLIIEVPDTIPTRVTLNKAARTDFKLRYFEWFPDYKYLTLLEFWKFLTPGEQHTSSIFSRIPKDKYKVINLLFTDGGEKLMLINLEFLMSCIEEFGIVSSVAMIKPRKSVIFKKIIHVMLRQFITGRALSDTELEQHEKELDDNPPDAKYLENETEETTEEEEEKTNAKQDNEKEEEVVVEEKEESKIKKRNFNIGRNKLSNVKIEKEKEEIEEQEKDIEEQDIKDEVNNLTNTIDEIINDNDYEDINDFDFKSYENKLKKEIKNSNKIKEEEDVYEEDDEEVLVIEDDKPNDMDIYTVLGEYEFDVEQIFPSLEEIQKETNNYKNVKLKIDKLKESKVITSTVSKSLHNILDKQENAKAPITKHGKDLTLKEVLDDSNDKLTISKEEMSIKENTVVLDESFNNNIINTLTKEYVNNQYNKDLVRVFYSLQNANMIVESYNINYLPSTLGDKEEHVVTYRSLDNKVHTIKIRLPIIQENGIYCENGLEYRIRYQRSSLPIVKINFNKVKLSSYYCNIFITKAKYKKNDLGYYILNQLVKKYEAGDKVTNLVALSNKNTEAKLPLHYSIFARYIKSFRFNGTLFNFNFKNRINLFKDMTKEQLAKLEKQDLILVANSEGIPYFINSKNHMFSFVNNRYEPLPNLFEMLELETTKSPVEFASIKIYNYQLPIGILLSFYYTLPGLMKILKTKHRIVDVKEKPTKTGYNFIITFADKKIVVTRDFGLSDMIIGGIESFNKILKEVKIDTLFSKQKMTVLFAKLGLSSFYINEFVNTESLFIDPITKTVLDEMKMPSNFKGLLFKACELLLDDNYSNPSDIKFARLRGYERFAGMVYNALTVAYRDYINKHNFAKSKMTLDPFCIIREIQEDSTTVLIDDTNPISSIKQTEDVSYLGSLGLDKKAVSQDTRVFNETEIGIISEATKDSGDVGITAYLSASPNLNGIRGTIDTEAEINQGNTFSTTALLMPFATTDDTKRLNFINIQSAHVVPINNMKVPHVRTGYETIIPIRVDSKFVISAEDDGVVTNLTKKEMKVEYKTKGAMSYRIKTWTSKEEAGTCYTHYMKPNFKVGDKFSKDDSLIYDTSFFEPDIFNPNRVIYKQGDIVTVALMEDPTTFEDSTAISTNLNKRLGTTITKVKSIMLDITTNILYYCPAGTKVNPSDVLLTHSSGYIPKNKIDSKTLEILKEFNKTNLRSDSDGIVSKIEVRYYANTEEMSETMAEFVTKIEKDMQDTTGRRGKITAGSYRSGHQILQNNQVEIKIFIEKEDSMGIGDKAIFANQLKCTVGEIFEHTLNAEDGTEIDALFSYRGISARIVNSPILIGTTGGVLDKIAEKAIEMYFGNKK